MAVTRRGRAVCITGDLFDRPYKGGGERRILLYPVRSAVHVAAGRVLDARVDPQVPGRGCHVAVVFAGVGFVEYYRKTLFLNPKVVAANQYDNYFRVNSVFFDPSIYGRFLALVMIARHDRGAVERPPARRAVGAAVLAWLLAGPDHELLAVEHRGAAAGAGGARGLALERARDRVRDGRARRDRARGRAAGAGEPALRAEGHGRLGQQRHQRAHEPDRRRPRTVR